MSTLPTEVEIRPQYVSIGRLFRENYIFRVPKYQRDYAWENDEVEDFCRDLKQCYEARRRGHTRHHFFGGLVSAARSITGSARRECDLVDGQQRLATFIIFISCLLRQYDHLAKEAKKANNNETHELYVKRAEGLKEQYICYEDEVDRRPTTIPRLKLSKPDDDYFQQLCAGRQNQREHRDSHRRLKQAAQQVERFIAEILNQQSLEDRAHSVRLLSDILVEDCTVIHIVTTTLGEAYRLFQVLNDRGRNLAPGDLLRAATLEMLDSIQFSNKQTKAVEMWDEILGDPPTMTEDFLRWSYSSHRGRRPGQSTLFDDFLKAFFPYDPHSTVSEDEAEGIIQTLGSLTNEVALLRSLAEGEWPYHSQQPIGQWHRNRLHLLVKELGHTNCLPLLLAATSLSERRFFEVVHSVEKFIFRYKIICNQHIGRVTNLYLCEASAIRQNATHYNVSSLRHGMRSLLNDRAPDDVFSQMLHNLTYSVRGGNKVLKYFLLTIEEYWRWFSSGARGHPKPRDVARPFDFANTTIEHLYPQNAAPATKVITLEPLKHRVGNLTILGPDDNLEMANMDFCAKRATLERSAIELNREIASKQKWSKSTVEKREDQLIEAALKVFVI